MLENQKHYLTYFILAFQRYHKSQILSYPDAGVHQLRRQGRLQELRGPGAAHLQRLPRGPLHAEEGRPRRPVPPQRPLRVGDPVREDAPEEDDRRERYRSDGDGNTRLTSDFNTHTGFAKSVTPIGCVILLPGRLGVTQPWSLTLYALGEMGSLKRRRWLLYLLL